MAAVLVSVVFGNSVPLNHTMTCTMEITVAKMMAAIVIRSRNN